MSDPTLAMIAGILIGWALRGLVPERAVLVVNFALIVAGLYAAVVVAGR